MKSINNKLNNLRLLCVLLAIMTAGSVMAADVTVTLDTGTSAFVIRDGASNYVTTIWSDGRIVAGGISNFVTGGGATVSGGGGYDGISSNIVGNSAAGTFSTISGGVGNGTTSNAWYATVGGGYFNNASTGSTTVAGGFYNGAYGLSASVGGGYYNSASGKYGTVPGGADSHASGDYSFAAGRGAVASNHGAFVWADATPAYFSSTAPNQFSVRASGGVRFFTDTSATGGVELAAGGHQWLGLSDKNLKENFSPVNENELLDSLDKIPMTTWNMKTQNPEIRHIGPMAQDFYAAFGMGSSDTHIGYGDADGVALAAIQGLYHQLQQTKSENAELKARLQQLELRLNKIEGSQ